MCETKGQVTPVGTLCPGEVTCHLSLSLQGFQTRAFILVVSAQNTSRAGNGSVDSENTYGLRLALGPLNVTSTLGKLRLTTLQFNTLTFTFF